MTTVVRSDALPGSADDPARAPQRRRRSPSSGCRRTSCARATSSASTCKRHGYRVIPVNPRETEILGEKSYKSLRDVPVPIDIVNVFRAPDALPGDRRGGGRDRRRKPVVPVHGDQRGRRAHRRSRRPVGGHGPLHQGRARPLRRPDALARLQHPAHHVGARRPAVVRS